MQPATVSSLPSRAAAKRWVDRHKEAIAQGDPRKLQAVFPAEAGDGRGIGAPRPSLGIWVMKRTTPHARRPAGPPPGTRSPTRTTSGLCWFRPMISERDVWLSAKSRIHRYGGNASIEAAERA